MIDIHTTPEAVARGEYSELDTYCWFALASARQLEKFIFCKKPYLYSKATGEPERAKEYIEHAKVALNLRLAEDIATAVSKLIQHTEKLTIQTDRHIQFSEKLTNQTEVMVAESKKLGRLTWGLLFLTVGLLAFTAVLLYIDWHREKISEKPVVRIQHG